MSELTYKQNGEYLFPEMRLSKEDRQPIGKYGMMRQRYLEKERPGLYTRMLLSGNLMKHLHEIEKMAQDRLTSLMNRLTAQNNVTEELKAKDQMSWVAQMNSLKHQAEESILSELIYS